MTSNGLIFYPPATSGKKKVKVLWKNVHSLKANSTSSPTAKLKVVYKRGKYLVFEMNDRYEMNRIELDMMSRLFTATATVSEEESSSAAAPPPPPTTSELETKLWQLPAMSSHGNSSGRLFSDYDYYEDETEFNDTSSVGSYTEASFTERTTETFNMLLADVHEEVSNIGTIPVEEVDEDLEYIQAGLRDLMLSNFQKQQQIDAEFAAHELTPWLLESRMKQQDNASTLPVDEKDETSRTLEDTFYNEASFHEPYSDQELEGIASFLQRDNRNGDYDDSEDNLSDDIETGFFAEKTPPPPQSSRRKRLWALRRDPRALIAGAIIILFFMVFLIAGLATDSDQTNKEGSPAPTQVAESSQVSADFGAIDTPAPTWPSTSDSMLDPTLTGAPTMTLSGTLTITDEEGTPSPTIIMEVTSSPTAAPTETLDSPTMAPSTAAPSISHMPTQKPTMPQKPNHVLGSVSSLQRSDGCVPSQTKSFTLSSEFRFTFDASFDSSSLAPDFMSDHEAEIAARSFHFLQKEFRRVYDTMQSMTADAASSQTIQIFCPACDKYENIFQLSFNVALEFSECIEPNQVLHLSNEFKYKGLLYPVNQLVTPSIGGAGTHPVGSYPFHSVLALRAQPTCIVACGGTKTQRGNAPLR